MGLGFLDIFLIILAIAAVLGVGLFFLGRWSQGKMSEQQKLITSTSQSINIYVIDKKKDRLKNVNLPKVVVEQMPRRANIMKMPLVKAKMGSQILTFICEKEVYKALPVKKNVQVDASGIYITNMKGMKSKEEMKARAKEKKQKVREEKRKAKEKNK